MTPTAPPTLDGPTCAARLADAVRPRGRIITAFSGGVDSTVVAAVARRELGKHAAPAAIGDSASLPRHELDEARALARQLDLELIEVQPNEQQSPDYQANKSDRCYHCKSHLYETLAQLAQQREIPFIANGTNTDDLGDHRPGLVAAAERSVISPLLDAQLGKREVRLIAQLLYLPNADKPAAACLASRLAYGTPVTLTRLTQVENAETVLRDLGFRGFRVRHHETVARIELPLDQLPRLLEPEMRERVTVGIKAVGYHYVSLDLEGFRSGSANVTLNIKR
jgi:uncharacterized protein